MQTAVPNGRRWTLILALSYLALLVPLGFYPFVFQPLCRICRNDVTVSHQGVHFGRAGIVTDSGAGALLHHALFETSEITLAVQISSAGLGQIGPARIISLSKTPSERNFTLGQQRSDLVLRLRTPLTGPNGNRPEVIARDVVEPGQTQFIVATYDGQTARLFVDGLPVVNLPVQAGGFSNWDAAFPLVLGNEATGDRPWRGTLHDAAVYARALPSEDAARLRPADFGRDDASRIYHLQSRCPLPETEPAADSFGSCEVPTRFTVDNPPKFLYAGHRGTTDYLQNVALYLIPGALLFAAFGGHPRRRYLLLALSHPLLIELMQVSVVGRTSSLQDGLSNWLGLALGAAAFQSASNQHP